MSYCTRQEESKPPCLFKALCTEAIHSKEGCLCVTRPQLRPEDLICLDRVQQHAWDTRITVIIPSGIQHAGIPTAADQVVRESLNFWQLDGGHFEALLHGNGGQRNVCICPNSKH